MCGNLKLVDYCIVDNSFHDKEGRRSRTRTTTTTINISLLYGSTSKLWSGCMQNESWIVRLSDDLHNSFKQPNRLNQNATLFSFSSSLRSLLIVPVFMRSICVHSIRIGCGTLAVHACLSKTGRIKRTKSSQWHSSRAIGRQPLLNDFMINSVCVCVVIVYDWMFLLNTLNSRMSNSFWPYSNSFIGAFLEVVKKMIRKTSARWCQWDERSETIYF